ncbi:MAG: hypothetical protein AAB576_01025, partial [Elusimicrobiota bacterium]
MRPRLRALAAVFALAAVLFAPKPAPEVKRTSALGAAALAAQRGGERVGAFANTRCRRPSR